ncbi:hypothetical protein Cob_v002150 [Colletotrichum orbiculare MAFF 240422]|uniref:Uncharacterized protein n=1 Tax=Colletotrichum orbiculare (strain 104-T / ATCC 96160 / CBS 514.97 / LARS 414 / MAFF 240422) TaxID=1213857 RepID=A0A484G443_COLOR|nr:hypothetical protein Cob_v002150 [Colletotrichum orbiculare MAFF 240422]
MNEQSHLHFPSCCDLVLGIPTNLYIRIGQFLRETPTANVMTLCHIVVIATGGIRGLREPRTKYPNVAMLLRKLCPTMVAAASDGGQS